MALAAGSQLGPYQIVNLLGAGGMGEVYRGHDPRLGRDVAIKILPDAFSEESERVWRFEREARAVASLNHPNICTVHDIGEHEGHRYLVMEMMEGQPLNERLQAGPVPMPLLLDLAVQMADALDAAHGAGVIHRDLKPANIFITRRGEAKLLDFGLAKLGDGDARPAASGETIAPVDHSRAPTMMGPRATTSIGTLLGTAAYMSPEQARGETVDAPSDLFSLGLVLYEMATGQPAFSGNTMALLFDAILNRDPVPIDQLRPDLPPEFALIVWKALEKDRELRYRTAADLRADLKRLRRDAAPRRPLESSLPRTVDGSPPPPSRIETPAASQRRAASSGRATGVGSGGTGLVLTTRTLAVGILLLAVVAAAAYGVMRMRAGGSSAADLPLDQLQVTQLTSTGNAIRPAISPDGKYIVYLQGENDGSSSAWLRQTGATNSVKILPGAPGHQATAATIGPDSTFVDIIRDNALLRVPFLGGTPRQIVDAISEPVGWSPDGQRMAYIRPATSGRGSELVVADRDGAQARVLAGPSGPFGFLVSIPGATAVAPAWAPDGRSIATLKRLGVDVREMGIAVYGVDGGEPREVKITGDVPLGLGWLDASTLLVVQALEQGTPSQVWRITYPDGRRLRLTNDVNRYSELSLSADANAFVTSRPETRVGVWVGDRGGEGRDVVAAAPFLSAAAVYATVAWDGEQVLFTHTLNGHFEVFRAPADGSGSPEAVVAGRDFATGPDGDIVLRTITGTDVGLWRVGRDGRNRTRLAEGSVNFPMVTHDGKEVVFSSPASGLQTVWRVPLAGGQASPLVNEVIGLSGYSDVSPDGRSIVMFRGGSWIRCDYPACTERRPMNLRGQFVRWVPDGSGISTVIPDEGGGNIWIHPLDGSAPRQVTHFTDKRLIGHYAWSRDGHRLAVARVSFSSDIVLFRGLKSGR